MRNVMEIDFSGRAAIVTGSSEGIGRALAQGLIDAGAHVLLVARREELLREAAQAMGDKAEWIAIDVTADGAPERIIAAAVDRFGKLDYLVNNTGLNIPGTMGNYSEADFRGMLDLNLISMVMMTQAAVPHLAERPGAAILNISSAAGRKIIPGNGLYGATKVAINYLTEMWAAELADRDIRVNAICPAATETPQARKVAAAIEGAREQALQLQYIHRMCEPEELVPPALMLLSDRLGGFITGTVMDVDAGIHI